MSYSHVDSQSFTRAQGLNAFVRVLSTSVQPVRYLTRLDLLQEIVDNPYILFGVSDGGAHTKFLTAGRYPTETLIKIVRQHGMLCLEDAHWRLSALPAQLAGCTGSGTLKVGAPADVVVGRRARNRSSGLNSVPFFSSAKHTRASLRPSATKAAVALNPRCLSAR